MLLSIMIGFIDGLMFFLIPQVILRRLLKVFQANALTVIIMFSFAILVVCTLMVASHWVVDWPLRSHPETRPFFGIAILAGAAVGKFILGKKEEP